MCEINDHLSPGAWWINSKGKFIGNVSTLDVYLIIVYYNINMCYSMVLSLRLITYFEIKEEAKDYSINKSL